MEDSCDVLVCGGGPAGIIAALAAARDGARTRLVERLGHLGGVATGAGLVNLCDAPAGPHGDELIALMTSAGGARVVYDPTKHHRPGRVRFHADTMKLVAARLLHQAGVEILFHAVVVGVRRQDRRVAAVEVADKSGVSTIHAQVVIDATADADVAAHAGAVLLPGDPEGGRQHVNFRCRLDGVDEVRYRAETDDGALIRLFTDAVASGRLTPPPGLFSPDPGCFPYDRRQGRPDIAYWELAGLDPTDTRAMSAAWHACLAAAFDALAFCREHVPGYAAAQVVDLPAMLGTRESRRIAGGYVLTRDDVVDGRKFADGVAKGSFWTDLHDSRPGRRLDDYTSEFMQRNRPREGDWYEIPYRCLQPAGVGGLLVAGRSISADREAHASARVVPTCMFIGSAAGTAAAMAVATGITVDRLDPREMRRRLGFDPPA